MLILPKFRTLFHRPHVRLDRTDAAGHAGSVSSFSWPGRAIGTPVGGRLSDGTIVKRRSIIFGMVARDLATIFSFNNPTIDTTTTMEDVVESDTAAAVTYAGLWIADWPHGTTAQFDITASEAIGEGVMWLFAAYNLRSIVPDSTNHDFETASAAMTLDLSIPERGIALAISVVNGTSQTHVWSGLPTESNLVTGSTLRTIEAHKGTPDPLRAVQAISSDWSGTADASAASAAFA